MPSRFQWAIDKVHPNPANGHDKSISSSSCRCHRSGRWRNDSSFRGTGFPVSELLPLASVKSLGSVVHFQDKDVDVQVARPEAFENVDIALFSAGGALSKELAPEAAKRGAIVIDNSSAWRMDPEVPLVITRGERKSYRGLQDEKHHCEPQLFHHSDGCSAGSSPRKSGAKPNNCIDISSCQRCGPRSNDELREQLGLLFRGEDIEPAIFPHPIAFNAIPRIDVPSDDGTPKKNGRWSSRPARSWTFQS